VLSTSLYAIFAFRLRFYTYLFVRRAQAQEALFTIQFAELSTKLSPSCEHRFSSTSLCPATAFPSLPPSSLTTRALYKFESNTPYIMRGCYPAENRELGSTATVAYSTGRCICERGAGGIVLDRILGRLGWIGCEVRFWL
jgi:hypothetical protein